MKVVYILFGIVFFLGIKLKAEETPNLMPMPHTISFGSDKFYITETLRVNLQTYGNHRLFKAGFRFIKRLDEFTGIFTKHEYIHAINEYPDAGIQIKCIREGKLEINEDESYILSISKSKISLEAETDLGILHGFETLLQLLASDGTGYYFPESSISDMPRFTWRGTMLDVSRHWQPLEVLLRNIDAMAMVKLNVLHFHITDDQGFRIQSNVFPKLTELGSDGNYFTQSEIKHIVDYASLRGIRVVPEFDLPGHSSSWLAAYPELGSAEGPFEIWREWGICENVLNPTKDYTYEFLEKLLQEITPLFPDKYFHIGGDEVKSNQWEANQEIQGFMQAHGFQDYSALQGYFNTKMVKILSSLNKSPMGWDETLSPSMPETLLIQSWRGMYFLIEAARKGHYCLLSNGYYLDLMHSTLSHYGNDPLPEETDLTPEQQKLILGGESCMWSEHTPPETIDSRLWPRNAAIAERLWSKREVNDPDDMFKRLEGIMWRFESLGVLFIVNRDVLMRRLTRDASSKRGDEMGGGDVMEEYKKFVRYIQPVQDYRRNHLCDINQLSPYSRNVDAAIADSKTGRLLTDKIRAWIWSLDLELKKEIEEEFRQIIKNYYGLENTLLSNPILKEIITMSHILKELSEITLHMMELYENDLRLPEKYWGYYRKIIEKAQEPYGETEIMFVDIIEYLYEKVLPQQDIFIEEKHFPGFIELDSESKYQIFYWLFKARANGIDSPPLIIWLDGGLGYSNLETIFYESGPFRIDYYVNLEQNPTSFNANADVLYLDQPLGTGYSVTDDISRIPSSSEEITADLITFFKGFIAKFPEYKTRTIYLSGQGYAGKYIHLFASLLQTSLPFLKLGGITLGNPLIYPKSQFSTLGLYAYNAKLTSFFKYSAFSLGCWLSSIADAFHLSSSFNFISKMSTNIIAGKNIYEDFHNLLFNPLNIKDPVQDLFWRKTRLESFLEKDGVKSALGVEGIEWQNWNREVANRMSDDFMRDPPYEVDLVFEDGVKTVVYVGVDDFVCNFEGQLAWIRDSSWERRVEFLEMQWKEWYVAGELKGKYKALGSFVLVLVQNSGHFVIKDQPLFAASLIDTLIHGI
jgi:hexosaminidase